MGDVFLNMGFVMASDLVAKGRKKVGYLYREEPDSDQDSGWRIFSGEEDQDYADDPDNFDLYDPKTIADIDPSIIPLLSSPPYTAFERAKNGKGFVPVEDYEFGETSD